MAVYSIVERNGPEGWERKGNETAVLKQHCGKEIPGWLR
jgi:hypothetical protein